jgi:predicted RNA methylase
VAAVPSPIRSRIVGSGEEAPDQLLANPRNWRIHPKAQQSALSAVLEEVGWVQQVIVNRTTGYVVDGHLRVALALSRSEPVVPVLYVELTPEEEALILASLDPLAGMAVTDQVILDDLVADLVITDTDLAELLGKGNGHPVEEDEVPEPPADPVTQPGDLWLLGEHRLLCGDSTDQAAMERLTVGQRFGCVVTDPPYGIEHEGITNDSEAGLPRLFETVLRTLPLGDAVVAAFQSPRLVALWLDAVRAAGHEIERLLWLHRVAAKTYPWRGWVMASDAIVLSSIGEPSWPEPADYCHDTYEKTELEPGDLTGTHTTIKPSWVFEDLMRKLPAGPVLEPFAGSGTALVAANNLGRTAYLMEIDPAYCDVIVQRWENLTGQTAVREDHADAEQVQG